MPTTAVMIQALIELRHQEGGVRDEHFWKIVERFRADLINQALAILENQADAEDVAQESLAQAFVQLDSLRDPQKLAHWLRSINRCNALDLRRRHKSQREQRLATGEQESLTQEQFPHRMATPAEETRDTAALVIRAVDSLPDIHREVMVLRCWEKMTLEQIAAHLGLPLGTVCSRIARADEILFKKLKALKQEAERQP